MEAAEKAFYVTEAFLLLTLTLIQKGVHTATLQVHPGPSLLSRLHVKDLMEFDRQVSRSLHAPTWRMSGEGDQCYSKHRKFCW